MALIPPLFLNSVVAIGVDGADGKRSWIGSGFFYGRLSTEAAHVDRRPFYDVYLVTNRHVINGLQLAYIRVNLIGETAATDLRVIFTTADGGSAWVTHPDPEIDVAVTLVNPVVMQRRRIDWNFFQSNGQVATISGMMKIGVLEGDGVFVLGFPMRMVGTRSLVIARGGNVARIRDLYQGAVKDFLVDASVYPGNSGGPVVLRPEPFAVDGTAATKSSYLIGIVKEYVSYQEVAVSPLTQRPRVMFEENSGLALAHPVDAIEETINHLIALGERKIRDAAVTPTVVPPTASPQSPAPETAPPSLTERVPEPKS